MGGEANRAELALLLRRLTIELDAVGERFAQLHGLGRTDVRALVAIMDAARCGAALTAGALGAAVDLSSASVTALVDRLERAGHVRRVRDSADRRRVVLEMSDSAMAAGAEFFGGLQADLVRAMADYSDEELAVVLPQQDHRQCATGLEAALQLGDPRRFRTVGTERRRVVLLDVAEPAAQRAERAGEAEPEESDDRGEHPAGGGGQARHDFP